MYLKYDIGTIIKNKNNQEFKIIDIINTNPKKYKVKSLKTGYNTTISRSALYSGKFKDNLCSFSNFGGIIGYANTSKNKKEYSVWSGMMRRCYDKKHDSYKYYGAEGIKVCERWKRFDYFLQDIQKVKGYNKEDFYNNKIELDKDLSQKKEYSFNNCEFLSSAKNNLYTRKQKEFCVTFPNGTTKIYKSKKEAGIELGEDSSCITKYLKGYRKHAKNYKFQYLQ